MTWWQVQAISQGKPAGNQIKIGLLEHLGRIGWLTPLKRAFHFPVRSKMLGISGFEESGELNWTHEAASCERDECVQCF